jgi:hypothetical protein
LVWVLLTTLKSFFLILYTHPLPDICFTEIFFLVGVCLFIISPCWNFGFFQKSNDVLLPIFFPLLYFWYFMQTAVIKLKFIQSFIYVFLLKSYILHLDPWCILPWFLTVLKFMIRIIFIWHKISTCPLSLLKWVYFIN